MHNFSKDTQLISTIFVWIFGFFFFNAANQKNYMRTLQFSHTVSSADLLLSLGEREAIRRFQTIYTPPFESECVHCRWCLAGIK